MPDVIAARYNKNTTDEMSVAELEDCNSWLALRGELFSLLKSADIEGEEKQKVLKAHSLSNLEKLSLEQMQTGIRTIAKEVMASAK